MPIVNSVFVVYSIVTVDQLHFLLLHILLCFLIKIYYELFINQIIIIALTLKQTNIFSILD